jgi:hypothetical protein
LMMTGAAFVCPAIPVTRSHTRGQVYPVSMNAYLSGSILRILAPPPFSFPARILN